jgi:hypothetical protein
MRSDVVRQSRSCSSLPATFAQRVQESTSAVSRSKAIELNFIDGADSCIVSSRVRAASLLHFSAQGCCIDGFPIALTLRSSNLAKSISLMDQITPFGNRSVNGSNGSEVRSIFLVSGCPYEINEGP